MPLPRLSTLRSGQRVHAPVVGGGPQNIGNAASSASLHEGPVDSAIAATVVAHAMHEDRITLDASGTRLVSPPNEFASDAPGGYRHEEVFLEEPYAPTVHADRDADADRHNQSGRHLWGRVNLGAYEIIFVLMAFSVTVMLTTPALVELANAVRGAGS